MKKTTKNSNLRIIGLYLFVFLLAVGVVAKIVKIQQFDELINIPTWADMSDIVTWIDQLV